MRRYGTLALISLPVFVLEYVGSHITGSMPLEVDAWHVLLIDNGSFLVAALAILAVRFGTHERKADLTGAGVNLVLIYAVMGYVLYESVLRLFDPPQVQAGWALVIAVIGGGANVLQHVIHERAPEEHHDHVHETVGAHILKDLKLSIGVTIGLTIVYLSDNALYDPLVSITAALWILWDVAFKTTRSWITAVRQHST